MYKGPTLSAYDKQTYARHQRLILDYFGFSPFDAEARGFMAKEIATMVRVQLRPKLVFLEAVQVLSRQKIALPSYFVLSTLIATAVTRFQRELGKTVKHYLTDDQRTKLDALLEKEPTAHDDGWRYRLTLVECLSLGAFFPERKYISMLEMLATVDHATNFLSEFEHWQLKYQRAKPPKKIFFAGIIGYGCDIGHRKLAQISKQIDENALDNAVNWYFSLQNVQGSNDRILQFVDRMNLPNIYWRKSDALHTSSDGQKFEVAVDSLNANYSFKYLGKDKGVSVVTFIDMRELMWHSTVISSAEREVAYVIDGLMHNDVIKSDIHSTDTHGYSEVIFAATYLLGFEFAPRIKGLGRQLLYAFKNRKHNEEQGHVLLPDRYIHEAFIEEQWDEVLRFIATIRLKVTTASQLFRRLTPIPSSTPCTKL